jgi:2-polyprenyl-3-methyl-5-hydroxy-6-metoxy-1,4-benzoquinol methylase
VSDVESVGRAAEVGPAASVRANRRWWDSDADAYHAEHGAQLGLAEFMWSPEDLYERDAHLLGPVADLVGARVLEVGCGGAMCSRWLAAQGARPVALDLSSGMLRHARTGAQATGIDVPLVQADAQNLPFTDGAFDVAFTAFGGVPFVTDSAAVMREVARVLRPNGRWVSRPPTRCAGSSRTIPVRLADGTTSTSTGRRTSSTPQTARSATSSTTARW